jgi:hypothetical protein
MGETTKNKIKGGAVRRKILGKKTLPLPSYMVSYSTKQYLHSE